MLAPYRGEPFLIIDNCRYGTKLADLVRIQNQNKIASKISTFCPSNSAIWNEFSEQL